jgi:abortive infection bacteriophage resistance protein
MQRGGRWSTTNPTSLLSQQVEKLANRGLEISDPDRAARFLETVGYYRTSAYAYPFREILGAGALRETSVQFRSNAFIPGAEFSWIEDIWRFDRELRLLILDAIETVEIALRSKVGYHLGLRHKFGHLDVENLDSERTSLPDADEAGRSMFEVWRERFAEHQERAATSEDFIQHYVQKYDGRLPIWVATEIMEFGQLVRLFGFMTDGDQ